MTHIGAREGLDWWTALGSTVQSKVDSWFRLVQSQGQSWIVLGKGCHVQGADRGSVCPEDAIFDVIQAKDTTANVVGSVLEKLVALPVVAWCAFNHVAMDDEGVVDIDKKGHSLFQAQFFQVYTLQLQCHSFVGLKKVRRRCHTQNCKKYQDISELTSKVLEF